MKQAFIGILVLLICFGNLTIGQNSTNNSNTTFDFQIKNFTNTFLAIDEQSLENVPKYFKNVVVLIHKFKQLDKAKEEQFNSMVNRNKDSGVEILFTHISLEEYPDLNLTYNINKDFTLCIYAKQRLHYFYYDQDSQFTLENIWQWIEKLTRTTTHFLEQKDVPIFFYKEDVKAVFFVKKDDTEIFKQLQDMIDQDIFLDNGIQNIGVVYVTEDSERRVEVLKLSQYMESNVLKYNFPLNQTEFVEFLRVSSLKIVNDLTDTNYLRIFASPFQYQVHIFLKKDFFCSENQKMLVEFDKAAIYNFNEQLHYERAVFVKSLHQHDNIEFQQQFGVISEDQLPMIAITQVDYNNFALIKYIYPENQKNNLTNLTVIQFLEDVKMKKVDPYYKSEHINEEENKQLPIKKITGENFRQMIYRQNKSVLVLYWDSKNPKSYKSLYQLFENFTKEVKPELYQSMLYLATFDLNLNENSEVNFDTAPLIVLYPQGGKNQGHTFRADYNVGSLRNFVSYWVKDLDIKVKVHIKLEDEPNQFDERKDEKKSDEKPLPLGGPSIDL